MAASGDDKSLSYFQKTVCLDEWWLIRAETEIEGKRLAVSGFTSREGQAVRGFSSAPVLKRHDVFTLETTDGICVMIKGFINKARTLENGFPSEVFSHFLFGFPPHWEACAEKFLGQGFATEDVSKVDASTIDSSEVTKENYEKANAEKSASLSASVADPKLDQDHGDIMIEEGSKKSNKAVRYSSRVGGAENNDPKKIAGAEKFLGQGFATEDVSKVDASTIDSSEVTKQNYEKANAEKIASLSASVADPKLDQDHGDIMILEGSKKSNKAVRHSSRVGGAENNDPKKIAGTEKFLGQGFSTEDVSKVDASTIDSSEVTKENYEKANAEKSASLFASVADPKLDQDHGDIMIEEGSKKSNKAVRYSSRVGGAENNDPKKIADAEKESNLKEACAEKFLGQGFASEDVINVDVSTMDSSEVTKENYEKVITEKTLSLSPCVAAPKLDQDRGDIMIQEVLKKSNKAVRFSSRLGGAENKDRKKIAVAEKESTLNEASTAVKKTKRKLTYGSPVTPRGEDLVSVVSPESFSCKRSRSGRLLLPTLEYWRNQTAIYDADHRITGIKEGINMPSTGIKSEPQRKRKKHT